MTLSKRLLLIFIVATVFGLINFLYMPREDKINNPDQLRIGSGDDITSLVLKKTLEVNKGINFSIKESEEKEYFEYTFKDC